MAAEVVLQKNADCDVRTKTCNDTWLSLVGFIVIPSSAAGPPLFTSGRESLRSIDVRET